jgi:hypothetical protein
MLDDLGRKAMTGVADGGHITTILKDETAVAALT